jgi:hypothetical protein
MTAIVAGVVPQEFVHLATRDADLMKIVWIVTDGAFVVLIRMTAVMMIAVVVVAVVVVAVMMVAVMMVAVVTRRGWSGRVVVVGKRRASWKKPQTNCEYQERNERDDQPTRFFHKAL